ncbi:mini-chromosome maintenance complex-binding protein [Culicoides brevitarsis]|uniref:mini-chromosome maintenance complex-binding protein n=1 Tax=Culicoides brevitarsis TaxID=469753 RepID=UPI00307B5A6E
MEKFTPEQYFANPEEFLREISSLGHQIPLMSHIDVDTSKLADCFLVRFRGMIQDMMDPELYLEKYQITNGAETRIQNGKYRDTLVLKAGEKVNYDAEDNVHGERRSVFVVSVPGVNSWVHEVEKSVYGITKNGEILQETSVETISNGVKRPLNEDEEVMETDEEPPVKKIESESNVTEQKAPNSLLSAEYLLNSPLPDRPSKACIVKFYEDFDSLTLNSVVDVIGFLAVDPALDGTFDEGDGFIDETERQATNPPPSLIPRLHAVKVTKLTHINPYFDLGSQEESKPEEVYKDLRLALSQCLFEDVIAADYLIAHLISTVHTRNNIHALGKLSLNISNIPSQVLPEFTTALYEIIEMLVPASHYFPMTLENMNTCQFVPKKDYKTNKLTSGILQLAPHTHLVLDETRLQVGKLEAAGVDALKSIADLINAQRLKYNFQFYEIEFDTDVPVLILSEGKSMLPNDCHIPLKPQADLAIIKETFVAVKHFLAPRLPAMRKFLTKQRKAEFDVKPEDTEMIQNAFVEMRRDNEKVTADDLHSLLVLSRLMALSRGHGVMSKEIWDATMALEAERKERVAQLPSRRRI